MQRFVRHDWQRKCGASRPALASLALLAVASLTLLAGKLHATDWPQFRGALSNSVSPDAKPPSEWTATKNVAWHVDLPGRGPSSPIVVGDRVIVTASSGVRQDRLHVLCYSASDGKLNWERQFWATGRTLSHPASANAAPTPASDGTSIFAFYSSNDLFCLDLNGNLKWLRGLAYDFPQAGNDVGMSSSPVVVGDVVVAQVESQGDSFATGIDKHTGQPRWPIDRPHESNWSSPVVFRPANDAAAARVSEAVLLQSPQQLTAHDPQTGKEIWAYKAACDAISSPVVHQGIVYVPSKGITALRPNASPEPEVVWNASGLQPGAASAIFDHGNLYIVNRGGVLTCADASNGRVTWRVRLQGEFWGTPALAGNTIYCVGDKADSQIVEISADGRNGAIVGTGHLDGTFQSSPAIAAGALYIRSDKQLWKIAAP